MEKIRVRFAPSPTGFLHVGNARTALFNWLFARQNNGVFILRVEDTDVERSREEYEKRLLENLRWLGLDWDEGPDVGGQFGPYRQSLRLLVYDRYTRSLLEQGKAFYCFCPPLELERERKKAISQGQMPVYSGKCRTIPPDEARHRVEDGEKAAIRLRTPGEGTIRYDDLVRGTLSFDMKLIGDPIIVRSSGLPAYNYAVVIDDALMKITHVIRGEDHISNTPRQILVYKALGFQPPRFAHLSMVMGRDNTRLSKRHGATAVDQFEKRGILPEALFNYLALLGWAPPDGREVLTREELIQLFDLSRVSRHSAIFDYEKLFWLNRQHMKRLDPTEKARIAYPHLKKAGFLPERMTEAHWSWLGEVVEVLSDRIDCLSDLPREMSFLFDFSPSGMDDEVKEELRAECARKVITLFVRKISRYSRFDYDTFAILTREIKAETGCKGRDLYHPLRIALTARVSGLKLDKFIPLVEKGSRLSLPRPLKNCSQRMSDVLDFMNSSGLTSESEGR